MSRYLILPVFLLAFVAASAFAADNTLQKTDTTRGGGLVCRTVAVQQMGSCDAACAKVAMICTGLTAMQSPEQGCGDKTITPDAKCRCCAIAK